MTTIEAKLKNIQCEKIGVQMSLFKKLFGGSAPPEQKAEDYEGYQITAEPQRDNNGYRIAARIEKNVDGKIFVHRLIRADTINDLSEAETASIAKAKQMIDQQGDGIFR